MAVSLLHRLAGAWWGCQGAIAVMPQLEKGGAIAEMLWQHVVTFGEWEIATIAPAVEWQADPLENALALLPVMLFFHEDPLYLGDRLSQWALPPEHLVFVQDLGCCVSDCLREKVQAPAFQVWLERRSPQFAEATTFLSAAYNTQTSWRQYQQQLKTSAFTPTTKQQLQLYGAMLWSRGNGAQCASLLGGSEPIVQAWGQILLGCLRGDRHSSHRQNRAVEHHDPMADIVAFWSRWSGLPQKNRLKLDRLPVIANSQGLKPRPSLQLISQHHLP